jgi:IS5 family transposase
LSKSSKFQLGRKSFGRLVKIQEAENQIITVEKRPADSTLFIKSLAAHHQKLGCVPNIVAGDSAFFSAANEAAAKEMGVKQVAIPNRSTKSADRRALQKKR